MRWMLIVYAVSLGCNQHPPQSFRSAPPDASDELARKAFDEPSTFVPSPGGPLPAIEYHIPSPYSPLPSLNARSGLSQTQLDAVFLQYKAGLVRRCWTTIRGPGAPVATETVHVRVEEGRVTSVRSEGNDLPVGTCLEREIEGWVFPVAPAPTDFHLPLKFVAK
jgi:hypothetical protein